MSESADQSSGPSNAAEYFGEEARELRESLGYSQDEFSDVIHYGQPQISKVERGVVLASVAFAEALDKAAGTPGLYKRLRERLSRNGHPEWFVPYVDLERTASGITDYSCTFLMGLLQTPEYAAAVFRSAHPREDADTIKARVETRMLRHEVMRREEPPLLWVIVHESVLRTLVGGKAVMVAQLEHLAMLMESPHVTVQVLPFKAGAPASHLPFTLLSLDDKPKAVYTETPTQGGQVDDSTSVVNSACQMFDRLRMAALSDEESLDLVRKITEEHAR
ncbi:helix-turn-helix transcriptional regulator [Streptomyces sp. NPDC059994]|uniref:helix-turn-helix domain-containing protein n=1 Tax=Streptomyces sp. NPDC059994 TaxID=3347029 RepID=UPI00367EC236